MLETVFVMGVKFVIAIGVMEEIVVPALNSVGL